jgi:SAM-dependent methyltransferase
MTVNSSANQLASDLAQLILLLAAQDGDETSAPEVHIGTPFSTMEQSDWSEAVQWWNRAGRHLIGQLQRRPCPACGTGGNHRPIFESYDGYWYEECGHCGCWHVPLEVDASLFERFFAECPQAAEICQRSFQKRLSEENQKADLARFDDYFTRLSKIFGDGRKLRYLDIGCGVGNSLVTARSRGFEATGVESSSESIRICREAGLDVRSSDESLAAAGFDIITFWESLEHMVDPAAMLAMCDKLLAEDGVIAFTIPNLNSPLLRAQRGDSSVVHGGYDTPGHINLFNPSHVRLLFERSGFAVLHMDGQYGMHLPELVSYMLGNHRGAADLITGKSENDLLTSQTRAVLQALGPVVSVLERLSLATPILFAVACRKSNVDLLARGGEALGRSRRLELLAQASGLAAQSQVQSATEKTKLREVAAQLQIEVNKRDELLSATQGEVDRRDVLLANQSRQIGDLQSEFARRDVLLANQILQIGDLQNEFARRDALLANQSLQIGDLQNEVARRDALLANQSLQIQDLQNEVDQRNLLLSEQAGELQEIKDGFLFKLARALKGHVGRTGRRPA